VVKRCAADKMTLLALAIIVTCIIISTSLNFNGKITESFQTDEQTDECSKSIVKQLYTDGPFIDLKEVHNMIYKKIETDPDLLSTAINMYSNCKNCETIEGCNDFLKSLFKYELEVEILKQKKELRKLLKAVTTNTLANVLFHAKDYGCLISKGTTVDESKVKKRERLRSKDKRFFNLSDYGR